MIFLNEQEIINKFLDLLKEQAKKDFNISLSYKKSKIHKPEETEEYKNYKNGTSSSLVKVDFEMHGWKTYSDEGFETFCKSILNKDEIFYPIINLDVYEVAGKGKTNVNLDFSFVFTRADVQSQDFWNEENETVRQDKEEIIRNIEMRLSEIYSLLTKLKKM